MGRIPLTVLLITKFPFSERSGVGAAAATLQAGLPCPAVNCLGWMDWKEGVPPVQASRDS